MTRLDAAIGPFIVGFGTACLIYVGVIVALMFVWWS
jgi:hypothetical protein